MWLLPLFEQHDFLSLANITRAVEWDLCYLFIDQYWMDELTTIGTEN
jgi:hypothetical protein